MSNKDIRLMADMINGEINRMCVTDQQAELDWMCLCAVENIMNIDAAKAYMANAKDERVENLPLWVALSICLDAYIKGEQY